LQHEYDVRLRWVAFPLHPDTPEEGMTLEELFRGRFVDLVEKAARLKEAADKLGLPYCRREKTYNSRLAQELGKWAEAEGAGDRFHKAVFHAYFAEAKNIAQIPVLLQLIEEIGLSTDGARTVLRERTFRREVDRDWEYSKKAGVTAVPTFRFSGRSLVGAQPYEELARLLEDGGVLRKGVKA
jgi:predicted DsbA family dithiol-disulfide isomerase